MKQRPYWQRLGIDILGVFLMIVAIPISWLPGPGGIPVLIIGLSLLANNHEWAERLLAQVKARGVNISQKIFGDDPRIHWLLDILSVVFIAVAVILATQLTRSFGKTVGLSLIISGLFLFFGNRKRYQKIQKLFKK